MAARAASIRVRALRPLLRCLDLLALLELLELIYDALLRASHHGSARQYGRCVLALGAGAKAKARVGRAP